MEQRRTAQRKNPQWKEEDLDVILALLDKDYTKPQAEQSPGESAAARSGAPVREPDELDELRSLISQDYSQPREEMPPLEEKHSFAKKEKKAPRAKKPEGERLDWTVPALAGSAAVEIVAIAAMLIWWLG